MSSVRGLPLNYPVELICIYDFGVQYRTVQYCAYRARLIQEEPEGNCVVSPAKISLASRQPRKLGRRKWSRGVEATSVLAKTKMNTDY